ncbi:MAG: metal ABC transporter substrate-binding protein [Armatimonadetes bacterium]|nr:metal ABC transporter substrate-binding protein [Armatimonadota bacterium]MDW8122513.1 metal ABC transporter substrate-binding protein [Armatimonadota bacterium]
MRGLVSLLAFLSLLFCGLVISQPAPKIRVVTTTADLKSLTEIVGGDRVQVVAIMRGDQNPHTVQLRPSFVVEASRADLFVRIGLDLELWADQLLLSARNPNIRRGALGYVDASVGVPLLEVPTGPISRAEGEVHIFGNPHYWLDPANAKIIVRNIADGLRRVAPGQAAYFEKREQEAVQELDRLLKETVKEMEPYRGTKVVAYHKTWSYLANRYGFKVLAYLEPKPGIPPSGKHVAQVIRLMQAEGIRFILKEPFYESKTPDLIARQTGAQVIELPSSVGALPGTDDYFQLIRRIIRTLVTAFAREKVL